jgi:carbon monoxide dehydrogenase subunit G
MRTRALELTSTFQLDAPLPRVWAVLTDLSQVAACLPGAAAQQADGGAGVSVTIGPQPGAVTARVTEQDSNSALVVITAEGGPDLTAVRLAATLRPWGPGTELRVLSDLTLSGRLARLGPGVIAGAGSRLLARFAANLETAAASQDIGPRERATRGSEPVPGSVVRAPEPAATAPPAARRENAVRDLMPGAALGATAAGVAASLVLLARRLRDGRRG